jgi:hypothetical protein
LLVALVVPFAACILLAAAADFSYVSYSMSMRPTIISCGEDLEIGNKACWQGLVGALFVSPCRGKKERKKV